LLVTAIRHQAPSAAFATAPAVIWPSNAALAPRRIANRAHSVGDGPIPVMETNREARADAFPRVLEFLKLHLEAN
jgi:hypothetical protein